MSLLPLLFSAWWADLERPHRLMDQNFGMGLFPDQLMFPSGIDRFHSLSHNKGVLDLYYRPLADIMRKGEGGTSTITADKDTFKVILDIQQFKPEEINVKLVDRFIVVEAKHEEKKDEHGFIARQFVRKYLLPEQADENQLASHISSDGILTISAPLKKREENPKERQIKIEFTGKPALRSETKTEGGGTTTTSTEKTSKESESREETTENMTEDKPEK